MEARELFDTARRAHDRIPELVALIEEGGFDWKPDDGVGGTGESNPTEAAALASIELTAAYRAELESLESIVGECLRLIEGVRAALGEIYANVLDGFYIDAQPWARVAEEHGVSVRSCFTYRDIALDWVDSVGYHHAVSGFGTAER